MQKKQAITLFALSLGMCAIGAIVGRFPGVAVRAGRWAR